MALSSLSHYTNPAPVVLLIVLSSAATVLSASRLNAPAPAAVDCSSLILSMVDCLSFVSNGSTVDKPEGTCCSGLKTVLKIRAECVCEAFKSSAQLGVVLNITKAMTLPAACKISDTSAATCALPGSSPSAAPVAQAPVSPPPSIATAPTAGGGAGEVPTAPAPGKSAAASLTVLPSVAITTSAALLASLFLI